MLVQAESLGKGNKGEKYDKVGERGILDRLGNRQEVF